MSFDIHEAISDLNPRVVPIMGASKGPSLKGWPQTQERVDDWLANNGGDLHFVGDNCHRYGIVLDYDMVVIDIDCHDGAENGYQSLSEIESAGGPDIFENCGLIVKSPSGGRHLYFKKDPLLKIPKNSKAFPAIDLLSRGSQVIGPGSNHVSGGVYEVEKWTGKLTTLGEELFGWFRPKRQETVAAAQVEAEEYWESHENNRALGDSPRDSFDCSTDAVYVLKAAMESQGYIFRDCGDHLSYTRPGKTDFSHTISGTLGRKNTNGKPYLHNFSTSDPNFDPESYGLSEAYKVLLNLDNAALMTQLEDAGFRRAGEEGQSKMVRDFLRGMGKEHLIKGAGQSGEEIEKQYPTVTLGQLRDKTSGGKRREYLVEGLLRRGEVMNVIAAPKVGKSWLVYNMALSLACGKKFLTYHAAKPLKVLICDNELHEEELTFRVSAVAEALGVDPEDRLEFTLLRGSNVDIDALDRKLDECGGSRFDIIVIDAFYRILPKGMSENDNAAMTQIYNKLDTLARKNEASVINIHHSSKGNQGDKGVTDVGAGAGSISRAADTHMVIREHSEEGLFVIDAVTRSGISPKPCTAKLNWPRWEVVGNVEPELKTFENQREKVQRRAKEENAGKVEIVLEYLRRETEAGKTPNSMEIFNACKLSTWGSDSTFKKNLKRIAASGRIKELPHAPGSLALRYIFVK